jgi:hypothetical protein
VIREEDFAMTGFRAVAHLCLVVVAALALAPSPPAGAAVPDTLYSVIFDFFENNEKLVSVDPVTGALTPPGGGIADCCLVASGVSTLDPNGDRFFFIGHSLTIPMDPDRIYSVDLDNGNVLASPPLPEGVAGINYNFIEYDLATDSLYAMIFDFDANQEKLVSIDPATGALTDVGTGIADCCLVASGVSSLDPNGGRFFFIGHSLTIPMDPDRIYSVDLSTGSVLASPPLPEGVAGINYNFVEYDFATDTLYAMIFDFDANLEKLVSIDPATGALTDVGAGIPDCCLVASGVSSLDPNGGRFFFIGHSLTIPMDPDRMYSVDLTTGSVLANPPLTEGMAGINYNFIEFDPLIVPPNQPPVALCQDVTVSADAACVADASIDDGSFDPDGGPVTLTQDPPPPYPLGDTLVELTVEDDQMATATCEGTVTVVDDSPPQIACNAPPTITPPDAPIAFTATAVDNCSDASVTVIAFDCFKFTKKGKRIDKTGSCVVQIDGATVTIVDSGGVGDTITWEVEATDGAGNADSATCEVEVVNPGHG